MITRSTLMMIILLSLSISCKSDRILQNELDEVQTSESANDFTEKDSQGEMLTLASHKGKVILLNFSAMWCGPCRVEASELEEIYEAYKGRGLEVIQCIFDNESRNRADSTDLQRWIQEFTLSFTVIHDPDLSTVGIYNVNAIPLNIIIDRGFFIRYRREGFSKKEIVQIIEAYF